MTRCISSACENQREGVVKLATADTGSQHQTFFGSRFYFWHMSGHVKGKTILISLGIIGLVVRLDPVNYLFTLLVAGLSISY